MNVLERERKKLEDRKQKNQDNIKANENNDVVGDESISEETAAWRHVSNFGKTCDKACCEDGEGRAL